jgi:inhibitor of KinA
VPTHSIYPLGDSALTIHFGEVFLISLNKRVLAVSRAIQEAAIIGIRDIVPAYSSITVHYDVVTIIKKYPYTSAFETVRNQLETILLQKVQDVKKPARRLKIPVCYAAKYGWDLSDMAMQLKLAVEEIVAIHTSRKYRVYMVGFLPGFAYMGEVDERIAVPRKQEPRLQIGEGYVGIAGKQTGIYPLPSPGGWQIVGRTPVKLFDKHKEDPVLFKAGDEVEFFSITENEFNNY